MSKYVVIGTHDGKTWHKMLESVYDYAKGYADGKEDSRSPLDQKVFDFTRFKCVKESDWLDMPAEQKA